MENLYNVNGLVFWTEEEIKIREMVKNHFVNCLTSNIKSQNNGFQVFQVEAPLLMPTEFVNKNYTEEDMHTIKSVKDTDLTFALRPETTFGSYKYIEFLLSSHLHKVKLPVCVWQHGKSFRREQDQPTKFMRLKEFYQLEFQIAYSETTFKDYSVELIPAMQKSISDLIGSCRIEASDRLPDYAESTTDIVCEKTNMEVASISKRKDFSGAKVLEVAIGTDRCVYNFMGK